MADTSGGVVIELLFKTNAGQILGEISGGAIKSGDDLDRLLTSSDRVTVQFNKSNAELNRAVGQFNETGAAIERLSAKTGQGVRAVDLHRVSLGMDNEAGKDFAFTINKGNQEVEGSLGPLRAATTASRERSESLTQESERNLEVGDSAKNAGQAISDMARRATTQTQAEAGAIQELRGYIADLKLQIEQAPPELLPGLTAQLRQANFELNEMTGKGLKNMRTEHRALSFQLRGTTEALFAMSLLLGSLSTQEDEHAGHMAKFKRDLIESSQSALGVAFALHFMGGRIGELAGPIGISVGALTLLMELMRDTNEESKKAAEEGLKMFTDRLEYVGGLQQPKVLGNIKEELKIINDLLSEQGEELKKNTSILFTGEDLIKGNTKEVVAAIDAEKKRTDLTDAQKDALKEYQSELEKRIAREEMKIRERITSTTVDEMSRIGELNAQIDLRNKELQTGIDTDTKSILTLEQRRDITDEVRELERQRKEIMMSTVEWQRKEVNELERTRSEQIADGKSIETVNTQYVSSLQLIMKQTTDLDLQKEIREKIVAIQGEELTHLKEVLDSNGMTSEAYVKQLEAIRSATTDSQRRRVIEMLIGDEIRNQTERIIAQNDARRGLVLLALKLDQEATKEQYAQKQLAEEARHKKVLDDIAEEERKALGIPKELVTVTPETPEGRHAREEEDKLHAKDITQITIERESEIEKIRAEAVTNEEERVRAKYYAETTEILKLVDAGLMDEIVGRERIRLLRVQEQREVNDLEMQNLDNVMSSVDLIGNNLKKAFKLSGDDFLSKMIGALKVALDISKALKSFSSKGGGGLPGLLGIFGSFLGIFGLFDEGGYTGSGDRQEPAGIVHKGEIVFEKPIVDKNKNFLLSLRDAMKGQHMVMHNPTRHSYYDGGLVVGPSMDSGRVALATAHASAARNSVDMEPLIAEIQRLRSENRALSSETAKYLENLVKVNSGVLEGRFDIDNGKGFFQREADENARREKARSVD